MLVIRYQCPTCRGRCFLEAETELKAQRITSGWARARFIRSSTRPFECVNCGRRWESEEVGFR